MSNLSRFIIPLDEIAINGKFANGFTLDDEKDDEEDDEEDRGMDLEERALPDSYVPESENKKTSCGTCEYFGASLDSERALSPYCNKWEAKVAVGGYCDEYEREETIEPDEDEPDEEASAPAKTGRANNARYITDNNVLYAKHPKYSDSSNNPNKQYNEENMDHNEYVNQWVVTQKGDRSIAYSTIEMRAANNGTTLVGYAAVFDSPSEPLPWTEFVRRGAFSKTIKDKADVRLLIDHVGVPLARTKSGTLRLTEDDRGLLAEADLDPHNPDAMRIMSAVQRGDMSQMSFSFRTIQDAWATDRSTRELKEVKLFDVSVVTYPAYEETVAELRNSCYTAPVIPSRLRRQQIAIARIK